MNKKVRKLLVAALVVSMILTQMLGITAFAAPTKYAGTDRYQTALAISKTYASADTVVLANGEESADALSATPYAYSVKAPILLTDKAALSAGVLDELARLKAKTVVIAGGTGAVSQAIEDSLKAAGYTVDRVSGADRFATSLAFAKKLGTTANGVVIANGYAFADALSIAPIAAFKGMPIILTAKDALSADAASFVSGLTGYIVGGTAVVGDLLSGATRLAGADRYATNDKIIEAFAADLDFSHIYLATGENGADALAGSVVAATAKAPLVLVGSSLNADVKSFLKNKVTTDTAFVVFGGASAVVNAEAQLEVAAPTTLAVDKVTALNGGQIQITFNKAIDKASLITSDDKLVTGMVEIERIPDKADAKTVAAADCIAKISDDDKVVTITAPEDHYFDGTYSLYIATGVVTGLGEDLGSYRTTFSQDDTTAPTVTKCEYNSGSNQIEVTLSEPVATPPTISINNGAPSTVTADSTRTKFTIDNDNDKGSTVTVTVFGAVDYLDNAMDTYTKSVSINMDETPIKVVTAVQDTSDSVKVVFDKAIDQGPSTGTAEEKAAYAQNIVGNALTVLRKGVGQTVTSVERDSDDSTNRTFYVYFASGTKPDYEIYPTNESKATLNLTFADGELTDVFGNTNNEINVSVSMVKDETGPKLLNSKEGSDNRSFELRFDEDITTASVDLDKITVRKDGVDVTSDFATAKLRLTDPTDFTVVDESVTSKKILVINYTAKDEDLAAGSYTVHLPDSVIADKHNNENDGFNTTIAVDNTDSVVTVTSVATVALNEYEVGFSAEVGTSAINPSSYTLNGATLPSDTDIYFIAGTGKTAVHITLDDKSVNYSSTSALLRNTNVKDSNGIKVKPASNEVEVNDNIHPSLVSASLTGNVLTLTFDENMDADNAAAITSVDELVKNIEITGGSTTKLADVGGSGEVSTQVDGKKVILIITAGSSNWSQVKNYSTIKVKTLGSAPDLTDASDNTTKNAIKKDITVSVTK